jgi:MFS transporter, UMF1 family
MAEQGLLARIGLHRPELRAWAMYDWANSAYWATVVIIFPIYFSTVAASGKMSATTATGRFAWATTLGMTISAVLSPLLGAVADYAAAKKKMLAFFMALGVVVTAALYFVGSGDWVLGLVLFIIGNIAVTSSVVFYESFLPHIAREDELDRVATAGFAMGYLGGGLLMALNLLWIQKPQWFGMADANIATRLSFVSVAIWWAVFSIPILRRVPEPVRQLEADEQAGRSAIAMAFGRLGETLRELRVYRNALLFMLAFLLYNDGIGTIIRLAPSYGTEIGIGPGALIGSILLVQFIGIPFSFLFGSLADRFGAKRCIFFCLIVYFVIAVVAFYMRTAMHFFVLAVLVGMVQGGSQALSRSLFASMIPKHKSSEFFGFFGVFDKFAGIFGPGFFAVMNNLTGSSRTAILSIVLFFALGAVLLAKVNVREGQQTAREAEGQLAAAPA